MTPGSPDPVRPRAGRRGISAGLALAALIFLATAMPAHAEEPAAGTIAFVDVMPGMTGHGLTVFSGSRIEPFEVEIIGKLANIAPRRSVIIARLSGGPLAETGVLQGMSGSPVYLEDGRLVGAVAYSWGFSKEPICGITPIGEMLDLLTRSAPPGSRAAGAGTPERAPRAAPASIERLAYPARVGDFLRDRLSGIAGASPAAGLTPLPIPLGIALGGRGAAGRELDSWKGALSSLGFSAVPSGSAAARPAPGSGAASSDEAPLEPGDAMGVRLIHGDVEMAAVGTVTWVRGEDFLAMGHNFLMLGPTALPATRAEVFGFLPSLESSFKLATATAPMGTITQDRFGGIAGKLGASPSVVPVKVSIASDRNRSSTFSFEIVDDPLLTPILMHLSFLQIFSTAEKGAGEITLSIRKGSQIRMEGDLIVNLENMYSGEQSELIASATVAYMTYLLMNNPDREARLLGVDLDLEYDDSINTAVIERIWTEREKVSPGETVPLYVSVKPYRGDGFTEVVPLEIPEEAPEGKAILQVGDAITLSRMEFEASGISLQPRDLEQLVFLLNRLRTNNKIYATLIRPDNGLFIAGERLPNLPPSLSTVIADPDGEGTNAARLRFRGILESERATAYALRGYQKAILEIRR
jgi:hypothetical protein